MKRANRVTSLALHLAIIFGLLTLPLLPGQANAASRSLSSYTVPRQANPSEGAAPAWVARYNGQGRSADFAKAIVVDAQGSVYVTGSTEGDRSTDAVTAKYDGAGKQLWLAQHAGSGSSPANAIALDAQDNVYITGSATVKYDKNGSQLWAANYPIMTWDDQAVTVATDSQGNVYVTGRSTNTSNSGDYATIKYDLNGNQLWVARYNGPDNGSDSPKALTLDAQGNVYVTGSSFANATGMDYATIKYDTRGNQLWVARYNMPGNGGDYATAIAVDGQGNTYVTGYSYGQGTGYDYATVKYDYNGNQLWVARYNGPGSGEDRANALKLDGQGNVYVTGTSWSVDSNTDYATVKYDTNGNQLWVARYDGPRFSSDVATALSMDGQANVYVTGYSRGVDSGMDYSTVKYDTNGNRLWVARYNGTGNGDDYARALAVDSQSNVYVTGESWGGSTYNDFGTVKYDANGDQLWVNRYNGPRDSRDYARAVAVDGQGNIYVTGDSEGSGTYSDYLTCKYDANGNQLWAARYDGSASRYDAAKALALDGQGNVYVTGSSAAANGRTGYTTVKYDANGNQLWVARYEGPGGYDFANGLVVDDQGNVYVTGSSQGAWNATPRTLSDYATVKYDPNGDQLWVARYNGPGNGNDYAQALAIDGQRNIYVTGQSWGGNDTKNDYATLKYDSTGNQLWVARYNGPGNGDDIAAGLAADSQGNVYVSGQSWGGNDTKNDYATVKYDSSGNQLWLARYNGSGNGDDVAKALAVDGQGNVYVTGQSWGGTDTKNDYATVKYDSNGNQLWLARYNAPGNWYDQANALVLDAQGNVYVTGSSWGDGYNYATLKYDSNGNQQWVVRYIGPGKSDWATALTVDGQGNVYVTGFSMGATTGFDYTTIKYMQTQALKESSFQVQNLSPTNTATVNIKYYNSDGSAAASETAFVSPSSSLLRDSRGGPNPMPSYLSVNFNGSVEVISDQPIVSSMNVFQGDSADGYNGVAQAEASRNILLPLIYGYGNRNLWHTRFTVQNPSDTAASITMAYADGTTGQVTNTVSDSIPAHGSRSYDQSTLSFFFGSVSITADKPVAAVVAQVAPGVLISYGGLNRDTEPGSKVYLPLLFKGTYWNTSIQVQNIDPSKPASVTIEATDQNTGAKYSSTQTVATSKSYDFRGTSDATTGGLNVPPGFFGSAVITSSQPIVAVVNEMLNFPGQSLDKIYKAMSYKGVAHSSGKQSLLPLLYRQNPWGMSFQVQNMGTSPATVTVTAKDQYTGAKYATTRTVTTAKNFDIRSDDTSLNGGLSVPVGFYGSATVSADQPIAVVVNQEDASDNSTDKAIANNGFQPLGSSQAYLPLAVKTSVTDW